MPGDFSWYADAALFADLDLDKRDPLAVNPPNELSADATPLEDTEAYLVGAVMKYVHRVTGGQRNGLKPMVRLAVEETYARLGYPHAAAHTDELRREGPSHEELRELPDPTPADFRETLADICEEPEEYVRKRQVAERTSQDALSLRRLLPEADGWELAESDQNDQSSDESAKSNTGIYN
jgi:hypothetical protein